MGGLVAGPVFTQVAEKVLAYLNVPHDAEVRTPQQQKLRAAAARPQSEFEKKDRC